MPQWLEADVHLSQEAEISIIVVECIRTVKARVVIVGSLNKNIVAR